MNAFPDLLSLPGIFLRILGMFSLLPFSLSLSNVGKLFCAALVFSLLFITPAANASPGMVDLALEFLVGVLISLGASLTLDGMRSLGELFDSQRGLSFAASYDPFLHQQNSLSSQMAYYFSLVVLICGGFLEACFAALSQSLSTFPLYSLRELDFERLAMRLIHFTASTSAAFLGSFLVCALIFSLLDLAAVFISKVLNQYSMNQEVFLLKTLFGYFVILALLRSGAGQSILSLAGPDLSLLRGG